MKYPNSHLFNPDFKYTPASQQGEDYLRKKFAQYRSRQNPALAQLLAYRKAK